MKNKWIKASEQKPISGDTVHAYNVDYKIYYPPLYYDDACGKWFDENYVQNAEYSVAPTHWCPMSNPPKPPKD